MKRSYKVLVIEDEPYWTDTLRRILEGEGCRVTTCKNYLEAQPILSRELFHFATIDLRLENDAEISPENEERWGGWRVLKLVKQRALSSTMGTMVISYYEDNDYRVKALRQHAATYFMSKREFDEDEFRSTLRSYLEEYTNRYFFEGIIQDSQGLSPATSLTEAEQIAAVFENVEGLRQLYARKAKAGERTIILFADLCDSTRYKEERGFVAGLFKSFNHNQTVEKLLREYDFTIVKRIGDCVMARADVNPKNSGSACTRVLNAAIRIQETFAEMNYDTSSDLEKYRSKIGIEIGVTADSYAHDPHGLPVDTAARLAALCEPEQILATKAIVASADVQSVEAGVLNAIASKLRVADLVGVMQARKIKGIREPIELCEIMWDGQRRGVRNT